MVCLGGGGLAAAGGAFIVIGSPKGTLGNVVSGGAFVGALAGLLFSIIGVAAA